jgi:integrase
MQRKETNARKGFFEHGEYVKMRDALPRDERDVLIYAYYTGCRRSVILKLTWDYVDLPGRAVRLPSEDESSGLHMRNDEGRIIPLGGPGKELYDMLNARQVLRSEVCPKSPWVFFGLRIEPAESITASSALPWLISATCGQAAANETGVKKLMRDLRRTGVRNLVRAGVPEAVAMRISGHKTTFGIRALQHHVGGRPSRRSGKAQRVPQRTGKKEQKAKEDVTRNCAN